MLCYPEFVFNFFAHEELCVLSSFRRNLLSRTAKRTSLHALKNGKHFTQSSGLVAVHPIAGALKDEYFYFAWLLRHEAFLKFNYDPDTVFSKKTDENGFKK